MTPWKLHNISMGLNYNPERIFLKYHPRFYNAYLVQLNLHHIFTIYRQ